MILSEPVEQVTVRGEGSWELRTPGPPGGKRPEVPLRELIQIAADAIRARRKLQNRDPSFGRIVVRPGRDTAANQDCRHVERCVDRHAPRLRGGFLGHGSDAARVPWVGSIWNGGNRTVYLSELGPFTALGSGEAPVIVVERCRLAASAAGWTWIDDAIAQVVSGLIVDFFGNRKPLGVFDLLYHSGTWD